MFLLPHITLMLLDITSKTSSMNIKHTQRRIATLHVILYHTFPCVCNVGLCYPFTYVMCIQTAWLHLTEDMCHHSAARGFLHTFFASSCSAVSNRRQSGFSPTLTRLDWQWWGSVILIISPSTIVIHCASARPNLEQITCWFFSELRDHLVIAAQSTRHLWCRNVLYSREAAYCLTSVCEGGAVCFLPEL